MGLEISQICATKNLVPLIWTVMAMKQWLQIGWRTIRRPGEMLTISRTPWTGWRKRKKISCSEVKSCTAFYFLLSGSAVVTRSLLFVAAEKETAESFHPRITVRAILRFTLWVPPSADHPRRAGIIKKFPRQNNSDESRDKGVREIIKTDAQTVWSGS